MNTIFERICDLLLETSATYAAGLTPSMPLSRMGLLDLATLLPACERVFGITIHDEAVCDLPDLAALARYIDERVAEDGGDYTPPGDAEREAWYYA